MFLTGHCRWTTCFAWPVAYMAHLLGSRTLFEATVHYDKPCSHSNPASLSCFLKHMPLQSISGCDSWLTPHYAQYISSYAWNIRSGRPRTTRNLSHRGGTPHADQECVLRVAPIPSLDIRVISRNVSAGMQSFGYLLPHISYLGDA